MRNKRRAPARQDATRPSKSAPALTRTAAPQPASSQNQFAIPFPRGGPRTPEGKAKSALNNLRHGLTGDFRIIDHEPQDKFDALVAALREEHQPATATEELLIQRMAEHYWLSRRARQLQDTALLANSTRRFALMLRYQVTNDNGFHRCFNQLMKLKKQRLEAQEEFESQCVPAPADLDVQNSEPAGGKAFTAAVSELRSGFHGASAAPKPQLSPRPTRSSVPSRPPSPEKTGV